MSVDPQFAIIIPTFNYGKYIAEAIDSTLNQQGVTLELIVVDDGSSDGTHEIIEGYGDRIKHFRQPNRGPYIACRRGLERTTAPLVMFLDADDRLCPGALKHAAEKFAAVPNAKMLFGPTLTLRPDGTTRLDEVPQLSEENVLNFRRYITGRLKLSAGGAVLHRSVFDRIWPQAENCIHGYDRVMVAQGLAWYRAIGTGTPLFELRAHEGRLRENVCAAVATGFDAVDALFDPSMIPPEVTHLRDSFAAHLRIEQARLLYRHGRYSEAREMYVEAFRLRRRTMLCVTNLRRFLYCSVRALFTDPAAPVATKTQQPQSQR